MTNNEALAVIKTSPIRYCIDQEKLGVTEMSLLKGAVDVLQKAVKDLEDCRNELCLYCGQYKQRHLGACDGCRWRET